MLKSITLITMPKSTITHVGWIMIAFLRYVTNFSTVVAYDCIVVLVSSVGIVISVVRGAKVRPIAVILVLPMLATVFACLQVVKYRHLHVCWQKTTLIIRVIIVVLVVFCLVVGVAWKMCFDHSFQAG